ncbi:hypothetical protein GGI43DRAFT_74866 [Trichoderma evansii]
MGFEKRCRESVSSKEGVNWNERPRGVTCFVERERRREGETTDLGGRTRQAGRLGGWLRVEVAVRTARYSYTDQGAGIRPVGVVKGKLVRWPARRWRFGCASAYSGSYEMQVQDAAGR